jgi:mycothiol synthase
VIDMEPLADDRRRLASTDTSGQTSAHSEGALSWSSLNEDALPQLRALALACLDEDGGLPLFSEDGLLHARLLGESTLCARDRSGRVVGVASLSSSESGTTTSGLVHPQHRGRGVGHRLMSWAVEKAEGAGPLTVLTETSSPAAEEMYAGFGLKQVFAELVMRHDLASLPAIQAPSGLTVVPAKTCDPKDLFTVYTAAFSTRPGFLNPTMEEWLDELSVDDGWNVQLSKVVLDGATPVAFINVVDNWVDQVGVAPSHRGQRIGACLVAEALAGLNADGASEAWLTVEIANPAAWLYAELGFDTYGKRARFA